ncbi:V-type ATP synthase subunit D [Thiocystis violascens]|uniref:H(+)-transporting ATP synthase, vacuolar type, subunit D n=1 Tax=Thiocystis violascens (strain ATCC 17096 / DSM 198 / 6111) TaxID=765911 RepID=I3YFQ6_THIV6|nr:V-type ATP synthase subunit D [Thiocystis violascens]AFL75824.1 H(+)-transporting ATP synthase, vacuolar type, subunit D [Thiocystis violascens DSM 198]
MARLSLSKSSLTRETRQLQTFERFLPALDLKRKQLMAERAKALAEQERIHDTMTALRDEIRQKLPMLANRDIALDGLVKLRGVRLGQENIMGTRLPLLLGADLERCDYGFMSRPHWVDRLVDAWSRMLELRVRLVLQARRVELLEAAVRKVTQRVNLFEKVLIPRTQANIKRIRIALTDAERTAVVRSKIAKGKRLREGLA